MEAIHGRFAAITKHGRGRRRALALAVFTIALMGMSAGSASAACPTTASAMTATSYSLVGTAGTRMVTDMTGKTNQGDLVTASVTVHNDCTAGIDASLVVYNAPSATWDPNTANQQQVYAVSNSDTTHLNRGANPNVFTVDNPVGCFQIDLVRGGIITQFDPSRGITYSAQKRLKDADNGDPGCVPLV